MLLLLIRLLLQLLFCLLRVSSSPAPVLVHHLAQDLAAILQHGGQRLSITLVVVVFFWGGEGEGRGTTTTKQARQEERQRTARSTEQWSDKSAGGSNGETAIQGVMHAAALGRMYAQRCSCLVRRLGVNCTHTHTHPPTRRRTFLAAAHQRSSKSRTRSGDRLLASSLQHQEQQTHGGHTRTGQRAQSAGGVGGQSPDDAPCVGAAVLPVHPVLDNRVLTVQVGTDAPQLLHLVDPNLCICIRCCRNTASRLPGCCCCYKCTPEGTR